MKLKGEEPEATEGEISHRAKVADFLVKVHSFFLFTYYQVFKNRFDWKYNFIFLCCIFCPKESPAI